MWTDLPPEILVNVFMFLNMLDLITGVSRTCRSWRKASKNPTLWRKIDATVFTPSVTNVAERPYKWLDNTSSIRIMQHLKSAVSLSSKAASCLIFQFSVPVGARELLHIALRTPRLKRVVLPAITRSNIDGFVKAVKHWRDLETVTLPCTDDHDTLTRALGKHCKRLAHLKLICPLKVELAKSIGVYLPGLRSLSLRYTLLYKEAVLHILGTLGSLEVLNLCHVLVVYLDEGGGAEAQLTLRHDLGSEVVALAARLGSGFLTCRGRPCVQCDGHGETTEAVRRWCESEEESWRYDEAPEFRL